MWLIKPYHKKVLSDKFTLHKLKIGQSSTAKKREGGGGERGTRKNFDRGYPCYFWV